MAGSLFACSLLAGGTACNEDPPAPVLWLGFHTPIAVASGGTQLGKLVVGEVTGDLLPDLVVVARTELTVQVLAGLGDGTFEAPVALTAGTDPRRVAIGDFNGDSRRDLVVIGHLDNGFYVLPGQAGGTFGSPVLYSLQNHGRLVTIEDVNGDTRSDIVVAHDGSGQPILLDVFLGAISGPLTHEWSYATEYFSSKDVVFGDVDGNGRRDLILGAGDDRASLVLFKSTGPGDFEGPVTFPPLSTTAGASDGTEALAVTDLDGDGRADLLVAHFDPRSLLTVRLGTPEGLGNALEIPSDGAVDIVTGDVDGDDNIDVVLAHLDEGRISIRFGVGDGTFGPPTFLVLGATPVSVALHHVNGDQALDLVVADLESGSLSVLINRGRGQTAATGRIMR